MSEDGEGSESWQESSCFPITRRAFNDVFDDLGVSRDDFLNSSEALLEVDYPELARLSEEIKGHFPPNSDLQQSKYKQGVLWMVEVLKRQAELRKNPLRDCPTDLTEKIRGEAVVRQRPRQERRLIKEERGFLEGSDRVTGAMGMPEEQKQAFITGAADAYSYFRGDFGK